MALKILYHVIAILIIAEGLFFIIKPEFLRKILVLFQSRAWVYFIAGFKVVFGLFYLITAREIAQYPWIYIFAGILLCIGGLFLLISGPQKGVSMIQWWIRKPLAVLRMLAFVEIVIGGILLYAL